MSQEMKNRIIQFTEEIWHKGNLDALEEFLTDDYIRHTSPGGREGGRDVVGIADARRSIAAFRAVLPDIQFEIDDLLAEGDKVVARWTCIGTHSSEFRGIAPTGKAVRFIGINIYRLREGKIAERWAVEDWVGLLQQLGAFRG